MLKIIAKNSAAIIEVQIPVTPNRYERRYTILIWQTSVLNAETIAEISPFPSAVKKDDVYIFMPINIKPMENIRIAETVKLSKSISALTKIILSGLAKIIESPAIISPKDTFITRLFFKTFFSSGAFFAP